VESCLCSEWLKSLRVGTENADFTGTGGSFRAVGFDGFDSPFRATLDDERLRDSSFRVAVDDEGIFTFLGSSFCVAADEKWSAIVGSMLDGICGEDGAAFFEESPDLEMNDDAFNGTGGRALAGGVYTGAEGDNGMDGAMGGLYGPVGGTGIPRAG